MDLRGKKLKFLLEIAVVTEYGPNVYLFHFIILSIPYDVLCQPQVKQIDRNNLNKHNIC